MAPPLWGTLSALCSIKHGKAILKVRHVYDLV